MVQIHIRMPQHNGPVLRSTVLAAAQDEDHQHEAPQASRGSQGEQTGGSVLQWVTMLHATPQHMPRHGQPRAIEQTQRIPSHRRHAALVQVVVVLLNHVCIATQEMADNQRVEECVIIHPVVETWNDSEFRACLPTVSRPKALVRARGASFPMVLPVMALKFVAVVQGRVARR